MYQTYTFAALLNTLKEEAKPEHPFVFDCDGTLLDGDVSTITGWLLMRNGLVDQNLIPEKFHDHSFYSKMTLRDHERIRMEVAEKFGSNYGLEWEVFIQSGLPVATVADYSKQAIELALSKGWMTVNAHCPEILREFKSQAWIVSGSPKPSVQAFADRVGVPGDRVFATQLEVLDGIYMARFSPPGFVWEAGKKLALESHQIKPYLVAGDTYGDWQMMEMATDWVWCVLWNETRVGSTPFKTEIEQRLGLPEPIPTDSGLHVAQVKGRRWVFDVRGAARAHHPGE